MQPGYSERKERNGRRAWHGLLIAFASGGLIVCQQSVVPVHAEAVPSDAGARYRFEDLRVPNAVSTLASSINASGHVAGSYQGPTGEHGFVYSDGTYTSLDVPGAATTRASSINASGQLAGSYAYGRYGFLYSDGTFTTLDVPTGAVTNPSSINGTGQVAGTYMDAKGYSGFVYSGGTYTTFRVPGSTDTVFWDINDTGQVTGSYINFLDATPQSLGFIYRRGTYTILGAPDCGGIPSALLWVRINDKGQAAGSCSPSGKTGLQGFLYGGGRYTVLHVPGSVETVPRDINNIGQVTGYHTDSLGLHGFTYTSGTYVLFDVPESSMTNPASINAAGQITGIYLDDQGEHGFIATPIRPFPAIKANLSDGPLTVAAGDVLSITAALNGAAGEHADWWLVAKTETGDWYYYVYPNQWILAGPDLADISFAHQGRLLTLNPLEVLKISSLAKGQYRLYFGVDLEMNGSLDRNHLYYDALEVYVQ